MTTRWERLADPLGALLDDIVAAAPRPCRRALDVGCGTGSLTRRIADATAAEVLGVDRSERMIELARERSKGHPRLSFTLGDVLEVDLPVAGFDLVVSVASLHHLDFDDGLRRMGALVAPGGVLAVVGLARDSSPRDYAASAVGVVQLRTLGRRRLRAQRSDGNPDAMPILDPTMTYRAVRDRAAGAAARCRVPPAPDVPLLPPVDHAVGVVTRWRRTVPCAQSWICCGEVEGLADLADRARAGSRASRRALPRPRGCPRGARGCRCRRRSAQRRCPG